MLNTHYVPGTMLEAGDTTASQEGPCPDRDDTLGETDHEEP